MMQTGAQKIGQAVGDVRSALPLNQLVPYLEKHVEGFQRPLEVKQFTVRADRPSIFGQDADAISSTDKSVRPAFAYAG